MKKPSLKNAKNKQVCHALPSNPAAESPKKIDPRRCIIRSRLTNERSQFRMATLKGLKYKGFKLVNSSYYFYEVSVSKLVKACRRMKCVRSFEIFFTAIFKIQRASQFLRNITRPASIQIKFGHILFFQQRFDRRGIGMLFRNLHFNLSSIHIEIFFGYGLNHSLAPSLIKSLIRGIKTSNNLRSLSICLKNEKKSVIDNTLNYFDILFEQDDQALKLYQTQFQRHRKLENLQLLFFGSKYSILRCLSQKFDHLQRLENLEVVVHDPQDGRDLIENLKRAKLLKSITLYYHVEPNDLLSLIVETPSLEKITIKDDWFFKSKSMSMLETVHAMEVNLTHLHLDLPMDIENNDDVRFIGNFLNIADQLRSLKVCLRCATDGSLLPRVAKSVNKLKNLQELILGVVVPTETIVTHMLQVMKDISDLQIFSIVLRPTEEDLWTKELQGLCKALGNFISRNKSLRELKIFWEKLTPQGMEYLREMVTKLPRLDTLNITYTSSYRKHGKNHENTLSELEKALKLVKDIGEVTVMTTCHQLIAKNCESKGTGMSEIIALNKNIRQFNFRVSARVNTPFHGETL